MSSLDQQLLDAHAADDRGALIALYTEAADQAAERQARSFFLTHAYVFALELGSPAAPALRQRLIDMGCESPLHPLSTSPR